MLCFGRTLCFVITVLSIRMFLLFFFQAEDGIRDAQESRGLGDVYKRQVIVSLDVGSDNRTVVTSGYIWSEDNIGDFIVYENCLLYTSDAADDLLCVDLGGRRLIKKKKRRRQK